jgi:uncharacterized protein
MGFIRSVMWKPVDAPGLEVLELYERAEKNRWRLEGNVLMPFDGTPAQVIYIISCDEAWQTRDVWITIHRHPGTHLSLRRKKRWFVNNQVRADLKDCVDVDLGITPATNTLPIRRLNLEIGESREVTAAWVRFPSLDVQPLVQTYMRLSEFEYRYESPNFETRMLVDDLGLVIEYEQGWTRVSSSSKL